MITDHAAFPKLVACHGRTLACVLVAFLMQPSLRAQALAGNNAFAVTSRKAGRFVQCFMLILACCTIAASAWAQPAQDLHYYTARLVRSPEALSPKPVLADVAAWLPQAEVYLEREADVLHINLFETLSIAEVRSHVEPHGFELAALYLNGIPVEGTQEARSGLPWSVGPDADNLTPVEIATRKDAWVKLHPDEYRKLLRSPLDDDRSK